MSPKRHQEAPKRATRSPDITGVLGFSHTKEAKNKTTLKASYHRCSRAINKLQAGTNRAQREPSDHKLSPVFLVFRTRERRRTKQHRKQAITGVLVQSKAPTRAPRRLKKSQQIAPRKPKESQQIKITSYHERSRAIQQDVEQDLYNLGLLSRYACRARWPDWGRMPLLYIYMYACIYIYISYV